MGSTREAVMKALPRPRPELRARGAVLHVLPRSPFPPERWDPLPDGARIVVVVHARVATEGAMRAR